MKKISYGMLAGVLAAAVLGAPQKLLAAEKPENACIWLKDDGYSFTPDLSQDELEEGEILSESVTSVWPNMGSDGVITDELLNFSYTGGGTDYMRLTEDGNYLFFFTDLSSDLSLGTLHYIQLDQLTLNEAANEKHLVTVDTDVYMAEGVTIEEDGTALYQKADEDGKCLYYFDGKNSFPVAEDVRYANLDGKIAYYEKYDEEEKRYSLYAKNLSRKEDEKLLVSDLYWLDASGMTKSGYYYLVDGTVFSVEKGHTLFRTSMTSGAEVLAENVDQVLTCNGKKIWYTKRERMISLIDYVDFSNSQYTREELNAFVQAVRNEDDFSFGLARIYSYDMETGMEERVMEDFLWEEDGVALMAALSDDGNRLLTGDFTEILPENTDKKSLDEILSDVGLSDLEAAQEALYEQIAGQMEQKMDQEGLPIRFVFPGEESEIYTTVQLNLIGDDLEGVDIFHQGEKMAAIKDHRLYLCELSKEAAGGWIDTGIEDADGLMVLGNQLLYMVNGNFYLYQDGTPVSLGSNCECWKSYTDGSSLLLSYFRGPAYGGNLWYIDADGNAQEIDTNVTRFAALNSGELLYIKEGKLILYSDGIKTRVADDARLMLPLGEKERTESRYAAW